MAPDSDLFRNDTAETGRCCGGMWFRVLFIENFSVTLNAIDIYISPMHSSIKKAFRLAFLFIAASANTSSSFGFVSPSLSFRFQFKEPCLGDACKLCLELIVCLHYFSLFFQRFMHVSLVRLWTPIMKKLIQMKKRAIQIIKKAV